MTGLDYRNTGIDVCSNHSHSLHLLQTFFIVLLSVIKLTKFPKVDIVPFIIMVSVPILLLVASAGYIFYCFHPVYSSHSEIHKMMPCTAYF